MTPFQYIKSRIIPLSIIFATILLVALILCVFNLHYGVIIVISCLLFLGMCAAFTWDYLSKRRFYKDLAASLTSQTEKYYLSELIDRPGFYEGQLVFDAIEKATKDMNDRIALYKLASDEYQEYIESWIHEVKTPLSSSKLSLENNGNSESDPLTKALIFDLDRIESYVEQALYYSRSTAVEKDYLIKKVNLETLVKDVVKHQSRALIQAGITPRFEKLDYQVYSDAKWLNYILGQIVANAIKYHIPSSSTHQARLCFSAKSFNEGFENSCVLLEIRDNGIGIPSTDLPRIFEKGFTGQNGRLYARSTGIGLYLCKKLCSKMKLSLSASSEHGQGTTIAIKFPLSKMYFLN